MSNWLKMAQVNTIEQLLKNGWSHRRIARELGVHRITVGRHARQLAPGSDSKATISTAGKPGRQGLCEPWRAEIEAKVSLGLSAQRIWQDLRSEREYPGSYESVKRFVRALRASSPAPFRRMAWYPIIRLRCRITTCADSLHGRFMRDLAPLQFLLALVAGIVNRHQQRVIDFLVDENKILKAALGKKRVKLNDDQRRRLAILGKALGRDLLDRFASIVTPETILRWHRRLVALKWTYANGAETRRGRPRVLLAIEKLVVTMAKDNANWGLSKIVGALSAIGHTVARSTIANILKRNGIAPSPDRTTSWATFLKAHAAGLAAADFINVEVWTLRGLRTFLVLFAIRHESRKAEILGVTDKIRDDFSRNAARNLIDPDAKAMAGVTHLIIDRDPKFNPVFKSFLETADVKIVLTPARSPNCNAIAERWVGTLRREILNRIIFFGEEHLRGALRDFVSHYHCERSHQSMGNEILEPGPEVGTSVGAIHRRDRLGGILRYYHRAAA